jgi:multidrug efflux pump subunit AcrA (membrane-fusion protein)
VIGAVPEGGSRSWKLRSGLRYLVRVPVETLAQRFVLPAGAVTEDGPDKVVLVADGKTFRKKVVHVEHLDDEVAVIANDGSLSPGDPVVTAGAFPLGLALQSGRGPADAHAGHGH